MEPPTTYSLKFTAQEILNMTERGEAGVLAVVIDTWGSAPAAVGAKMVVLADRAIRGTVGGGVVEARVITDAIGALEDGGGPRTIHYQLEELGMSCGGEMWVYLEPLQPPRRVIVYGGGHVAAAVARVLKTLGCRIRVVDERAEWANRERFPDADEIINRTFAEEIAAHPPGPADHLIIVTRGHKQDQLVLEGTIEKKPAYLGMIGSRRKASQAVALLVEKKVSEELLQRVHSPIGLDIGAVSPEEIAVSIAAELILLWRRGKSRKDVPSRRVGAMSRESRAERSDDG